MATNVLVTIPLADEANSTNCPSKIMEKAEKNKKREKEATRITKTKSEPKNNFNE